MSGVIAQGQSGNALILHLNSFGTVLHMEICGWMQPFRPRAECLGRTLKELLPEDIGSRALHTIRTALLSGQFAGSYMFSYDLKGWTYMARMTYLREGVVLCVIQTVSDEAKFQTEVRAPALDDDRPNLFASSNLGN